MKLTVRCPIILRLFNPQTLNEKMLLNRTAVVDIVCSCASHSSVLCCAPDLKVTALIETCVGVSLGVGCCCCLQMLFGCWGESDSMQRVKCVRRDVRVKRKKRDSFCPSSNHLDLFYKMSMFEWQGTVKVRFQTSNLHALCWLPP